MSTPDRLIPFLAQISSPGSLVGEQAIKPVTEQAINSGFSDIAYLLEEIAQDHNQAVAAGQLPSRQDEIFVNWGLATVALRAEVIADKLPEINWLMQQQLRQALAANKTSNRI